MRYYIGTEAECNALNSELSNTHFGGWNYGNVMETIDGDFYLMIREEDLHLLSDEQMMNVVDNVEPKVIDGAT